MTWGAVNGSGDGPLAAPAPRNSPRIGDPGALEDGVPQPRGDEVADRHRIAKPDLGLGGVDVDVDPAARELQIEDHHRVAAAGQQIPIRLLDRPTEHEIPHPPAVDEQVGGVVARRPVQVRRRGEAHQGQRPPLDADLHHLAGVGAQGVHRAHGQAVGHRRVDHPPPAVVEGEADVGPGQGGADHGLDAVAQLGGDRPEERPTGREVVEQVAGSHHRARRAGRRLDVDQGPPLDPDLHRAVGIRRAGDDLEPADGGDRRQGLAAKAVAAQGLQIPHPADLRGGVALDAQQRVLPPHAHAVVGHLDQGGSAVPQGHIDARRPGIERVLHQLLDHRRGALDHLPRGDLVDDVLLEDPDPRLGRLAHPSIASPSLRRRLRCSRSGVPSKPKASLRRLVR